MTTFSVSVSQRPQLRLFGLSVRTNMADAFKDCSHLWEEVFGPRMHEVGGEKPGECTPSYGISIMLDARHLEYWAAVPAGEGVLLPEGMGEVELPAGWYAGCLVPSMAQLGEAYTYLYETWPKTASGYAPNMQAPGFEYYDERYLESGAFEVYMPVLKV